MSKKLAFQLPRSNITANAVQFVLCLPGGAAGPGKEFQSSESQGDRNAPTPWRHV